MIIATAHWLFAPHYEICSWLIKYNSLSLQDQELGEVRSLEYPFGEKSER